MQPNRPTGRMAPGSFSPLPTGGSDLSRPRRLESSSSEDTAPLNLNLTIPKARAASSQTPSPATPIYASFTSHSNGSSSSLHNFSRPTLSTAISAARSVAGTHSPSDAASRNGPSPLTLPPRPAISPSSSTFRGHSRKHSQNAGVFEPTLPSTSASNLSHIGMAQSSPKLAPAQTQRRELSASQIAAQAAVMQHQNQQQQVQQQQIQQAQLQLQHARQRSQTVPAPGAEYEQPHVANKRTSGGPGPLSPPMLSLTEASAPRESGFGNQPQGYHNGLVGNHTLVAAAAANLVFPRSGQSSPGLPSQSSVSSSSSMPPPALPPPVPEKPAKSEKSKVKLFSRPAMKIGVKGDTKEKPLPSPAKIGHAFGNLQRGNFSTTSLDSSSQSFYSLQNSSTATIRALDTSVVEKEVKEKEKKHHFLSRQKHKLKEDYHLPLSSASSNSRPTDPSAPNSLYNFNLPPSPGPNSTSFKSMSGLDLRHGGRALREKKKEERLFDDAASTIAASEWPGPSSVSSTSGPLGSSVYHEPFDSSKFGLNNMTLDDAWPFLKAKLLVVFEAEDLRLPVEDLNRIVSMHIQYCIARRSPNIIVDDLRELLATGFSSLDQTLRKTPEDRLIPALVELWMFTFTGILPYLQAVFLPLDLEFSGSGSLMTSEQARDFWGGIPSTHSPVETSSFGSAHGQGHGVNVSPASSVLEVRRLVLLSFRDIVILPRYETLKTMFSRLSLEFLPQALASMALTSPVTIASPLFSNPVQGQYQSLYSTSPAESSQGSISLNNVNSALTGYPRPNTAMSLDPSVSSFHSAGSTLLGDGPVSGNRSRAISNVSYGSDNTRPYTPNSLYALGASVPSFSGSNPPGASNGTAASSGSLREQNVEGSKQVTEMVGRMLQCMSVLASVGHVPGAPPSATSAGGPIASGGDEGNHMIEELNKLLKLNWLGRGRTGRNRRGIVGGRVKRGAMMPPPLMGGLSNTSSSTGGVGLGGGSSSASVREEK
jgi:hypothetical protein